MNFNIPLILSITPFALFLILLLVAKLPLLKVSVFTAILALVLKIFYWKIIPLFVLNSFVKGTLVAFDIFIIIFGAIFFLEVLNGLKIIENISYYLESALKDYRVQVILLAWMFENFIEGTAGFGTPASIVVPLLVSIGLSPLTSVVVGMLGNSTAGAFGAVGTPVRVGFAGLDVSEVTRYGTIFNLVGFMIPVLMLWFLASTQKEKWRDFWEAVPFALWAGIAFVVPSYLVSKLGPEFPSVLGSLIGMLLILITIKFGLFIPKTKRLLGKEKTLEVKLPIYKTVIPYVVLIALLLGGKYVLGSVNLEFPWGFVYKLNLFNPGLAFLITGLPFALLWGKGRLISNSLKLSLRRSTNPFLVIVSMSTLVQLMINSGNNLSGLPSSLVTISKAFEISSLPFFAPFIGGFGGFITGSVTVSNIMFGSFLNSASLALSYPPAIILSLGLIGGAAGNMIALADVIAAEAVVDLKNQTRFVIKALILPCLFYLTLVGILGLTLIRLV